MTVAHDPFRGVKHGEYKGTSDGPEADPILEDAVVEDAVPSGTTKEILAWVGNDTDRARRALENEEAKGSDGLKGLQRELKAMLENA